LLVRGGVRTLRDQDASATLAGIAAGQISPAMLAWVPLMAGADQSAVVEEWRRVALREPDERRRGNNGGLARVLAELAGRQDVWAVGLEGWNVEVSQVVLEWQRQARAEGEARGRVQGVRDITLRLLQKHLKSAALIDVVATVEGQSDPAVLERWLDAALTAQTWAEVRAAFGLP
jgi:hypothetical protein